MNQKKKASKKETVHDKCYINVHLQEKGVGKPHILWSLNQNWELEPAYTSTTKPSTYTLNIAIEGQTNLYLARGALLPERHVTGGLESAIE